MALKGPSWARQLESNCIWGLKGTFLTRYILEERVMICYFFSKSLQSFWFMFSFARLIFTFYRSKAKEKQKKVDGTNSCQKPARCKSAAKIGLSATTDRAWRGTGQWKWWHSDTFCEISLQFWWWVNPRMYFTEIFPSHLSHLIAAC